MQKFIITTLLLKATITFLIVAQPEKPPLTHDVYDGWNNLARQQISADGRWVSWEVNPQEGDGWLYLQDLQQDRLDSVPRGNRAVFSPNSDFMAFYVSPPKSILRQALLPGPGAVQMPGDSVGIYVFASSSNTTAGRVETFTVAGEESSWMVYLIRDRAPSAEPTGGMPQQGQAPGEQSGSMPQQRQTQPGQPQGARMIIFNPVTGQKHEFPDVVDYSFSKNGKLAAFIQTANAQDQVIPGLHGYGTGKSAVQTTVNIFNTTNGTTTRILEKAGSVSSVTTCDQGLQAAFLVSSDNSESGHPDNRPAGRTLQNGTAGTAGPDKSYDLWYWKEDAAGASKIVTSTTQGMPEGWNIRKNQPVTFSGNGDRLFFGTAPTREPRPREPLLADEKYSVDIWHYRDSRIQPQQLVELLPDQNRAYPAAFNVGSDKMVQLARPDMPGATTLQRGNGNFELGTSALPYQIQNSFESGEYTDIYLIDVNTGNRRLVLEKHRGSIHRSTLGDARLSPGGRYLIWYSQADSNWHAMSTTGNKERNITADIPFPLFNEQFDQPSLPGPYGIGPWTEDDRYVLIYDRYDIWKVDPTGSEKAVSLTGGYGRANNIRFRHIQTESEKTAIGAREAITLSAFHIYTKQSGFYTVRTHRPSAPARIIMDDVSFDTPVKAKDANVIIWRKGTFTHYPDLWVSDPDFHNPRKLSSANPRQSLYKWGTAELVEWVSFNHDSLQGILYRPENMEPGKKYPMIVYFYERMSDNLHRHYVPAPSRATINIPYTVSNDYLVFVPDIPYAIGYPGQSAYNAIISGTQAMLSRFDFIDRLNIGIQGHSWAGYQITWLLTRTGMFRAAMAGAPVANMTSAYGGIRWETGLSRIYQYEESQSRLGGSLWQKPLLYLENSPLFYADKISTPLLMMHNDNDGAVPWYQGIEFFMALRRLDKPVWMLNYNGEVHSLTRRPNMKDLSVRMHQFFDHYLKDEPQPAWMHHGIPATEKGRMDGYELIE